MSGLLRSRESASGAQLPATERNDEHLEPAQATALDPWATLETYSVGYSEPMCLKSDIDAALAVERAKRQEELAHERHERETVADAFESYAKWARAELLTRERAAFMAGRWAMLTEESAQRVDGPYEWGFSCPFDSQAAREDDEASFAAYQALSQQKSKSHG